MRVNKLFTLTAQVNIGYPIPTSAEGAGLRGVGLCVHGVAMVERGAWAVRGACRL